MDKNKIRELLYAAADGAYKDFNSKIINTVDKDRFIGVRTPELREIARDMLANDSWTEFIADLPHHFFEENQLHAFIISEFNDFDFVIGAVEKFLPYVDNWATCDQMSPKIFAKNPDKLLPHIKKWIKSKHVYTVRFAVLCLMRYFLDGNFDKKYADMVLGIKSNEYYVNMAMAWYFATGVAKHPEKFLPYFKRLDDWTRGCAIEKAIASYRVSETNKLKLKELRKRKEDDILDRFFKKSPVDLQVK